MKTLKSLLLVTLSLLLNTEIVSAQNVVWQMHDGEGMGIYTPPAGTSVREILSTLYNTGAPQHGDPGGFAFAQIPAVDDEAWGDVRIKDNCDNAPTLEVIADSMLTDDGDYSYTYTLITTDASGNENIKTASFLRQVDFICPTAPVEATLDENGVFIPTFENLGLESTCLLGGAIFNPSTIPTLEVLVVGMWAM